MSSGGSGNAQQMMGTANLNPYEVDPTSFQQYLTTNEAQTQNGLGGASNPNSIASQILAGKVASDAAPGSTVGSFYAGGQAGVSPGVDISSIMNSYNTWLAGQTQAATNYSSYTALADQEMGRDQTILSGPAAMGNRSALG